jgi:plasminogen activator inhibitor 1 RNA-binding protein
MHQSWGGDDGNAEFKTEVAATNDAAAEAWGGAPDTSADAWGGPVASAADDAWGAPPAGGDAAPAPDGEKGPGEGRRREREPEEEDNTLTLDQYLAQKKGSEVIPKLESTRKANEGADASIWKDVVPLKKGDEDEDAYFVGKGKAAPKARTEKKEKVFLEIEARFERPSRGGRGGRGGDRGGASTGPPRARTGPNRGRPAAAVDVGDVKAFPSLS